MKTKTQKSSKQIKWIGTRISLQKRIETIEKLKWNKMEINWCLCQLPKSNWRFRNDNEETKKKRKTQVELIRNDVWIGTTDFLFVERNKKMKKTKRKRQQSKDEMRRFPWPVRIAFGKEKKSVASDGVTTKSIAFRHETKVKVRKPTISENYVIEFRFVHISFRLASTKFTIFWLSFSWRLPLVIFTMQLLFESNRNDFVAEHLMRPQSRLSNNG